MTKVSKTGCIICQRNNPTLHDCQFFINKTTSKRRDYQQKNGLCFGCLTHGHFSKNVTNKSHCSKFKGRHPTCLHGDYKRLSGQTERLNETTPINMTVMEGSVTLKVTNGNGKGMTSIIVPVYLSMKEDPDTEVMVYALLDIQSDTTFILEDTADKLLSQNLPDSSCPL
ncbi:uncharacterized protein LOC143252265 isoform X1 [Tachypleus tridentatus]|uniref:uncharacterized protein LOC143252265 isoform X1 n=1 Tax=Tachypleus tridentatus TaxID=6853 RepID=UPI003FCFE12E